LSSAPAEEIELDDIDLNDDEDVLEDEERLADLSSR
jgi:hypothetical protein